MQTWKKWQFFPIFANFRRFWASEPLDKLHLRGFLRKENDGFIVLIMFQTMSVTLCLTRIKNHDFAHVQKRALILHVQARNRAFLPFINIKVLFVAF